MNRFLQITDRVRTFIGGHRFCSGHRTTLLAVLLLGTWVGTASADIWYVDNENGQDTNSGRTEVVGPLAAGPFRTISRALKAANIGDSIVLAKNASPYRESITLAGARNSGFQGQPFRLIGNGAILSGTHQILRSSDLFVADGIYECRPADAAFQQLYVGSRPAQFQAVTRETLTDLAPLAWTLIDGRVYFRTEDNQLPDAYELHYAAGQTGITLYLVRNVSIENLTVQGFWQDGINAHDNVAEAKLVGVTVRGNGRSGISAGGSSRLDVVSSLVGDNWQHQVRVESVARIRLLGSNILPNGQGEAQLQEDGGKILEAIPVVNAPIEGRLSVTPLRQARAGSVLEPSETPTRSSRLYDEATIYR